MYIIIHPPHLSPTWAFGMFPSGNFQYFIDNLEKILSMIYSNTIDIIICGDINIKYLIDSTYKQLLVLYPLRTWSGMILDIVPGGTELGTQVKTGSRAGRTHTLNNPQVKSTGVLLCVIRE